MEEIKVYKRPKLRNPYLIAAWPGMGEVAFKAATYLVEKLNAREFAELPPEEFYYLTASIIKEGVLNLPRLPFGKFYYWKNNSGKSASDLVIFISSAQPDLNKAKDYCGRIIRFSKSLTVRKIVTFAAMPQPIDHTQPLNVWYAATSAEIANSLKKYQLKQMSQGQISGMNGLFLGMAKRESLQGFCLLADIPLYTIQIENPRASYAVLEVLAKMLGLQLEFRELIDQAHLMESEINKLLDYLKIGASGPGPIGEEDIERIKKSLSQITKLPGSVKEKIEKLFDQTRSDITKANELKTELDKWNVYMEYEDRFLDLFRNNTDKSN